MNILVISVQTVSDIITNSSSEVSIIPKGEASSVDVAILNKINDLFCIEACYN